MAKKTLCSHLAWHLIIYLHTIIPWMIGSYIGEGSVVTITGPLRPPQYYQCGSNSNNSDRRRHPHPHHHHEHHGHHEHHHHCHHHCRHHHHHRCCSSCSHCFLHINIALVKCCFTIAPILFHTNTNYATKQHRSSPITPFNAQVPSKNLTMRISLKPDLKPLQNVMFLKPDRSHGAVVKFMSEQTAAGIRFFSVRQCFYHIWNSVESNAAFSDPICLQSKPQRSCSTQDPVQHWRCSYRLLRNASSLTKSRWILSCSRGVLRSKASEEYHTLFEHDIHTSLSHKTQCGLTAAQKWISEISQHAGPGHKSIFPRWFWCWDRDWWVTRICPWPALKNDLLCVEMN